MVGGLTGIRGWIQRTAIEGPSRSDWQTERHPVGRIGPVLQQLDEIGPCLALADIKAAKCICSWAGVIMPA